MAILEFECLKGAGQVATTGSDSAWLTIEVVGLLDVTWLMFTLIGLEATKVPSMVERGRYAAVVVDSNSVNHDLPSGSGVVSRNSNLVVNEGGNMHKGMPSNSAVDLSLPSTSGLRDVVTNDQS